MKTPPIHQVDLSTDSSYSYLIHPKYLGDGVTIVQQDISTGLIALYKPSGMLSHPNDSSSPQQLFNSSTRSSSSSTRKSHHTLIRGTYHYKDEYYLIRLNRGDEISSNKSKSDDNHHHLSMNNSNNHIAAAASADGADTTVDNFMKVWLLHRLDSATSGVILVSINPYVAQSVKEQFILQKVYKLYVSVVIDESKLSSHEMRATVATEDELKDEIRSRRSRSKSDVLSTTKNKRKQQQQLLFEWEDSISINKSHNTIRVTQYHHHDHPHNSFNDFSNTSYKVARTKAYFYNASNNIKTVHNNYPNNQYSNLHILNPNCSQTSFRDSISPLSSSQSPPSPSSSISSLSLSSQSPPSSSSSPQSPPSSSSSRSSSCLLRHPYLRLMFYEPHTGYSHQLRVQSAHHGYPILGDRTYGNFKANKMILKLIHNMKHDQKNVVTKQSSSNHKSEVMIDSIIHDDNYTSISTSTDVDVVHSNNKMISHHDDNDGNMSQKSIIINSSSSCEVSSMNRLFLHSHKVEVSYQFAGHIHQFKALSPIPSIFSAII